MKPLTKWNAVLDRAADIPRTFRAAFEAMTTGRPGRGAHRAALRRAERLRSSAGDVWADPTLGAFPSRRVAPDPFARSSSPRSCCARRRRPLFICGGGVVMSGAEAELHGSGGKNLARRWRRRSAAKARSTSAARTPSGVVGSNGGTPQTRAVVDAGRRRRVRRLPRRLGDHRALAPSGARTRPHHPYRRRPGGAGHELQGRRADRRPTRSSPCPRWNEAVDAARRRSLLRRRERSARNSRRSKPWPRSDDAPIRPERVVAALDRLLGKDAILVADPGTPCPYFSAYYVVKRQRPALLLQPRARRARLCARRGARRACRPPGGEDRGGDGRRQLRHVRGRARDFGAPQAAAHLRRDLERGPTAGSRPGRSRATASATSRSTSASPTTPRWRRRSASEAGGSPSRNPLLPFSKKRCGTAGPTLVDIVCQPLHEARAPVSEWVA